MTPPIVMDERISWSEYGIVTPKMVFELNIILKGQMSHTSDILNDSSRLSEVWVRDLRNGNHIQRIGLPAQRHGHELGREQLRSKKM